VEWSERGGVGLTREGGLDMKKEQELREIEKEREISVSNNTFPIPHNHPNDPPHPVLTNSPSTTPHSPHTPPHYPFNPPTLPKENPLYRHCKSEKRMVCRVVCAAAMEAGGVGGDR